MSPARPPSNRQPLRPVSLPLGLQGWLRYRPDALGMAVFAHGSGSGRNSPRNNAVAESLAEAGIASLLFDLLTEDEAWDRRNVFDIPLLSERLDLGVAWLATQADVARLPVGLFGASTGAAAALQTAARLGERIAAVVSRGGRPDLAGPALPQVSAPTLLIVGGLDYEVLMLNRQAMAQMRCECRLQIVPGASHLFEERGTLEAVAALSIDWFRRHLAGAT